MARYPKYSRIFENYLVRHEYNKALAIIKSLEEEVPNYKHSIRLNIYKGEILRLLKQYELALSEIRSAKFNSFQKRYYYLQAYALTVEAEILRELNKNQQAIEALNQAKDCLSKLKYNSKMKKQLIHRIELIK